MNLLRTGGLTPTVRRLQFHGRTAFTLVELLVVITIITLLAATLIVALAGAQEQARDARTRSQIAKLHEMITERYESYRTRAVPLRPASALPINNPNYLRSVATNRLNALRELMRMELPDRISDINDAPVSGIARPALSRAYQKRYAARTATNSTLESAECLYMIVSAFRDGDATGLDFLQPGEIGDVDNDGLPEILDGWGTPIAFLRWAPGFVSPVQDRDPAKSPDPFDPLGVYYQGGSAVNFALYPLIVSAGPDKDLGILLDDPGTPVQYSTTTPKNDPYTTPSGGQQLGEKISGSAGYADNIHNHNREVR